MAPVGKKAKEEENIRVCARFRPRNERERIESGDDASSVRVEYQGETTVRISGVGPAALHSGKTTRSDSATFHLDRIYGESSSQEDVYAYVGAALVKQVFAGYNGTVFAYGQTSSGKTHTMFGPDDYIDVPDEWGIVPKAMQDLFEFVARYARAHAPTRAPSIPPPSPSPPCHPRRDATDAID